MRKSEIFTAAAAMVIAAGLALAMSHAASERVSLASPELKMNCLAAGGQYVLVGNGGARACLLDNGVIAPAPAGSSMP